MIGELGLNARRRRGCRYPRMREFSTVRLPFGPDLPNPSRSLAEFWVIEPEIAFADISDNAALAEGLPK